MRQKKMILHIIRPEEWEKVKNLSFYYPNVSNGEGFLHCSTPEQLKSVEGILMKCENHVKILWIDEEKVTSKIIYEDLYHNGEEFPHIYGALNLDAVSRVEDLVQASRCSP